jgi:RNA polymerase sigma factor (sigma-70 family)
MAHDTARSLPRSLQEELPAHGRWVQRLARSLVREEASADDLAQDVQLAALRHGPTSRGALAPWLARVTRNLARRGWRDAARRAARERAVARPEVLPGADESVARLEMQRLLVEELSRLEPAQRHALVRRYFDGWTAARIARENGEPAPTVRWRLQRGLSELRARLDRRSGGDGLQWRLALLPVCGRAGRWSSALEALRPLAGAGTFQGVLTMKAAWNALAAGALLAALSLGAWWSMTRDERARAEAPSGSGMLVAAAAPADTIVAPSAPAAAARESVASVPPPAKAVEEPVTGPGDPPRVAGRCVDERLVPVPGARIEQIGQEPASSASSTRDGTFSLEVLPDWRGICSLRVEAAGFATRFLALNASATGTISLGDVVLGPGGSVRGRVLDPRGAPFVGADVTVTEPDLWGTLEEARVQGPFGENLLATESGDGGRFEIAGVGAGPVRVWAGAAGMRHAVSAPVEVRARETTEEIELQLEPIRGDDRIRGIVLTPAGEPVPGAGLDCMERAGGGMTSFSLHADDEGRFELAAKPGRVYDLDAIDPGERWSAVRERGLAPGSEVELRFQEARWIEVSVRAGEDRALADFTVDARTPDGDDFLGRVKETAGSGSSALARLRTPAEPFQVQVDARGFRLAMEGPFTPEDAPASLVFELAPEPGVHGRVVAGGEPLSGARVALHEAPRGSRIDHQGYLSLVRPRPLDTTITDAQGRFTLRLRKSGTYVVRAEAAGHAAGDSGELELLPETGMHGLELVLGRGGRLEGRVRVAPGRDPAGVIVSLNRGDAFPRTMRSDFDGLFGFEGLTPGRWVLARGRMEFNSEGGGTAYSGADEPIALPFNCTIVEGETTYMDLDLSDCEPCVLTGVLRVNGAPAADWGVSGWPGGAEAIVGDLPTSATAADGSFALTIAEPGRLRLSFSPPAESEGSGRIDVLTEVRPGPNEWQQDFAMGRLAGRCLSTRAGEELLLFYSGAPGVVPSCWLPVRPDESGRFVLPFVPAGRGMIRRLDESDGDGRWTILVETEVVAGQERALDVP